MTTARTAVDIAPRRSTKAGRAPLPWIAIAAGTTVGRVVADSHPLPDGASAMSPTAHPDPIVSIPPIGTITGCAVLPSPDRYAGTRRVWTSSCQNRQ